MEKSKNKQVYSKDKVEIVYDNEGYNMDVFISKIDELIKYQNMKGWRS